MPKKRYNDEVMERVRSMTENGFSQGQIGETIGVHATTVGKWQKKLGLKASNKWHFGETAKKDGIQLKEEKPPKPKKKYTKVVDKTIKFQGTATKYEYVIGMHSDLLKINPGYTAEIEIDLKDLVAFANELVDIAEAIEKMRSEKD